MNARELFDRWAPEDSPWSAWAKPVLFAATYEVSAQDREHWSAACERVRGRWAPPRSGDTALVLDLDGPDALALALECAHQGYRPVPLFNSSIGPAALLDNGPIRAGLELGRAVLSAARLTKDASPVFALDARRTAGSPKPRAFDNRWLVFPQDFPSVNTLLAQGIRRAVLVQQGRSAPQSDLAHVLLRWQRGGISVLALDLADTTQAVRGPTAIEVKRPSRFRFLAYRLLATLGLRRSSAGGFGSVVPQPSSGVVVG